MPRLSKIGAAALAAFGWTSGSAVSASYLVVAGGGGGGGTTSHTYSMGGGGAGGLLTGMASLNPTQSYTVTVGAGGVAGSSGSSSIFNTATSIGGGSGGASAGSNVGANGGSGGGGAGEVSAPVSGGTGTSGQGNNGGTGNDNSNTAAGGGGGASAVGANATTSNVAGAGGNGTASSISGSSVTYAGGGGGGAGYTGGNGTGGAGGTGGGGTGSGTGAGTSGTANLGGGGGGGKGTSTSGNGGSGIVIISYVGAQQFSGGVVTSSGGNTIHTFTTSGTLGPVTPLSANYLVVAGGGSGGGGYFAGGGGAGGLLSGSSLTIDPYSTYLVTVGAGAAAVSGNSTNGLQGSNSAFSMVATAAVGGGYGAGYGGSGVVGGVGGSGGGTAANALATVAAGTSGQGNAGGQSSNNGGGGGGGAGSVGGNAGASFGTGGTGSASSISGASVTYAAGAAGGISGVGNGASGTANTGNGGAASSASGGTSGAGGSGVVIISYAGATQLMAGGVVTIAGGNVIHTFNSSGYLSPLTLLTRSLRFRGAYPTAPSYLSRTAGTPTNNLKWTYSLWVKRGVLGVGQFLLNGGTGTSASEDYLAFFASDKLSFGQANASSTYLLTASVYRDPAAWYHIVFVYDSAQATASNRALFYVNGVQVTSFTNATYPTLNQSTNINASGVLQRISSRTYLADEGFDGYMAEVNFIDGQALAPTAFGTVNSYGVWQPITYGGSYGTNGFRLPFTNNASTTTLGYDFSPQGNNWTTNNISVTAGSTYDSMTDVPTLTSATAANFAVMNPLIYSPSAITFSNGNLVTTTTTAGGSSKSGATFGASAGKFYAEATITTYGGELALGVIINTSSNIYTTGVGYDSFDGSKYVNGTNSAYGATYGAGAVIGIALDLDGQTVTFYKNNTSQGTISLPVASSTWIFAHSNGTTVVNVITWNFGQRPFTYTPPTGFLALNTFNL